MVAVAPALAGCAVGGLGAIGPAPTPAPVAAPPPVVYGAFLEGPAGQKLSQVDRDKALVSEQEALASGQRKTWRGDRGTYGFVEPAPGAPPAPAVAADGVPAARATDVCRAFTSTIYVAGRPQVGHGSGCANPDGTYRIVG